MSLINEEYDRFHRARYMEEDGRVFDQLHLTSSGVHDKMKYDERYTKHIRKTGLLPFITLVSRSTQKMNPCAITTLIDRWRPETHTFHLHCGEMTVTLQDVSMILALPIKGDPICFSTDSNRWRDTMVGLIGKEPGVAGMSAGATYHWISENFSECPAGHDEDSETVQQYARAYCWLLTPPGTPRVPALEVAQKIPSSNILPKRTVTRSSSTTRASRLSVSQTENGHSTASTRPARSNSVTRPSIQSTLMSSNNRTSVLNTSISSVSSRPTTPSRRSNTITAPKQPVPASRPVPARSSTPVKARPSTPAKTRPSTPVKTHQATSNSTTDAAAARTTSTQSSRPSTPNSRSRIISSSSSGSVPSMSRPSASTGIIPATTRPGASSSNVHGTSHATSLSSGTVPSMSRSSSRSSTPTRQPAVRSSAPAIGRLPSFGRTSSISSMTTSMNRPAASSGRSSAPSSAPSSRPSSPGPRPRAPVRSHDIPSSAPSSRPSSPGPRPRAPVRSHDIPSSAPSSRPSSPGPRPRAPVRPLDIPDFPSETPPNLRTKLPERPLSAGRSRPGMASGIRSNSNAEQLAASSPAKKISVPAAGQSKFSDAPSKAPSRSNGHQSRQSERSAVDSQASRAARPVAVAGTDNGFGRTISKNSLDMAIKHMDIRQNLGGIRGASLFPHSIRSSAGKMRPVRMSDPGHPTSNGDRQYADTGSANGHFFSGDSYGALSRNGGSSTDSPDRLSFGTKETLSELDIYGSTRYEAMLLREDVKNTSWLHGFDDKPDQSPLFDHRFEPLPEPFSPF